MQWLILGAVLLICSVSDLRRGLVYDWVTLPALAIILLHAVAQGDLVRAVLGASCASSTLLLLHVITRGRGMGLGDVKLAAVIGAAMHLQAAMAALGAAFVCGALVGFALLIAHRAGRTTEMRFAPFLALGVVSALVATKILQ